MKSKLMAESLLKINDLKIYFPVSRGLLSRTRNYIKAVDGVDLEIKRGETLGIVGESGSGKSTLALTIAGLYKPSGGEILFKGASLTDKSGKALRELMKPAQMVFQDPYGSFNSRMTVGTMLKEAMTICKVGKRTDRKERALDILRTVGISEDAVKRYPHEFSGGQRQRLSIARALAANPEFLVLDEPVSALDVSMQAQILNLLKDLQSRLGLTYLFIAHDVSVVKHMSTRVAVMYLGRIVEVMKDESIDRDPMHPYTISLVSSIPTIEDQEPGKRKILKGDIPSPIEVPSGCRFRTRCEMVREECRTKDPRLLAVGEDHQVACLMYCSAHH
jgi:oligopeptide/dipeptide ABC transporter ATP-binding protein